jgi:protein O-GlcNAc transferase
MSEINQPEDLQVTLREVFQRYQAKDYVGALAQSETALLSWPEQNDLQMLAGLSCFELDRWQEAIKYLETAVENSPSVPNARYAYGVSLRMLGDFPEAIEQLKACITLNPKNSAAWHGLAMAYYKSQRFPEAIQFFGKQLELAPNDAEAWSNMASAKIALALLPQGLQDYQKSMALNSSTLPNVSNYLLALNYVAECSAKQRLEAHRSLAQKRFPAPQDSANKARAKLALDDNNGDKKGDKKNEPIRVGFVSPDMHKHSVSYFFLPFLQALDTQAFEVHIFYNQPKGDSVTEQIKSLSAGFTYIADLTTEQACDGIRLAQIDILVDLAGHTAGNRLDIFAAKPAPIQASWLGYPNSTGLSQVDFRIGDAYVDPDEPGANEYLEKVLRLPTSFLCYEGQAGQSISENAPAAANGYVTFACFNNMSKVSEQSLELFASVLNATPKSRLMLKSKIFGDEHAIKIFKDRLGKYGIDEDRLEFVSYVPGDSHLQIYNQVDIALDTYPYNGTTTTCEALWMGVPTITLKGNVHAARVSSSLLRQVGLERFIAETPEEYAQIAKSMANEIVYLTELRRNLREQMLSSSLCDAKGFASEMEAAFKEMLSLS